MRIPFIDKAPAYSTVRQDLILSYKIVKKITANIITQYLLLATS